MTEEWRAPPGLDGIYEVSTLGRLRRLLLRQGTGVVKLDAPVIVKPKPRGKYLGVTLCRDGWKKQFYIHDLVLLTFVGPAPPGHEGAHDDGVRTHNALSNLAWKTRSQNHMDKWRHGTMEHGEGHRNAKLTVAEVLAIRSCATSSALLAERFDVSSSLIRQVRLRKIWRHV